MVDMKAIRSCAVSLLSLFAVTATANSQSDASNAGPLHGVVRVDVGTEAKERDDGSALAGQVVSERSAPQLGDVREGVRVQGGATGWCARGSWCPIFGE